MNQKEKRQHLFRTFLRSKGLFACFSLVLSLLLVLGSTYAWITSADERVNRADANRKVLSAIIEEDFDRVFDWAPGVKKTKQVKVRNNGEMPTIVRLSLKEFFASFEVDTTDNHRLDANPDNNRNGNANLKSYGTFTTPIDVQKTDTWVIGHTYEINANTYYKADQVLKNQAYIYGGTRILPLAAFELTFATTNVFNIPAAAVGKQDYWYYEKGYFYYSEVLQPNEVTTDLLESITLNAEYANQYKGALYKLVPEMDAHDLTKELISDWGIHPTNDHAYQLYKDKLAK
ncbi:BsaA family SipW-dependent biofilm matrix protein [Enterococcus sp. AZ072]|uniref:BsaA family SipW-dependent biofilm matrix protein n=1 Tax=unclassified Enterococcus TaxID=2608891 RepID=UPI003D2D82FE